MPPVLAAGFRPFFLAAALWSAAALALWLAMLVGDIDLPSRFDPLTWHIHEMLFGFVMAAIGGFLLTAIPNWTGRPPISGTPLGVLVALWLLGRVACMVSVWLPAWLAVAADLAFAIGLESMAARELIAAGNRRNYPLLVPLVVLTIANLLMHLQVEAIPIGLGWRLGIAAVTALISVIGGRVVPNFTRNWLTARGIAPPSPLPPIVDRLALGTLHAAMLAWAFLPDWPPLGAFLLLAAVFNLVRLSHWGGIAASAEPLLLVLHVGYVWLVAGVALLGLSILTDSVPPAAALHALTAGAMGTMIIAMMTRATLGHSGRALQADAATMTMYALVSMAAILRIAATWTVDAQPDLLEASALAWVGAFALFAAQYGPMLLAARA